MSLSYHRTACFVSSAFLLTACASDAEKLKRLQNAQMSSCLLAQADQREYDLASRPLSPPTPSKDSIFREYMDDKAECDLATRDLNRFMR